MSSAHTGPQLGAAPTGSQQLERPSTAGRKAGRSRPPVGVISDDFANATGPADDDVIMDHRLGPGVKVDEGAEHGALVGEIMGVFVLVQVVVPPPYSQHSFKSTG